LITAKLMTEDMATELTMFHGKTAKEVYKQMAEWEVVSMASHAFDLGAELQKAEIALNLYLKDWKQDRRIDVNSQKIEEEVKEQIEAPTRYVRKGKKVIPIK